MPDGEGSDQPKKYEARIVVLMSLGFGLVGIDRFMISTLYPEIARDLHLGYGDIGTITGALALAWGLAALVMGNLSDRIGRRHVLTVSLVIFSLLIGASGLAAGLMSLILVRVIMGFADGAYTPSSICATLDASPPERRGLNIGIQQMMLPLFGLGLAPLAVAWLLHYVEWRLIFSFVTIPGLILSWVVWRTLPNRPRAVADEPSSSFADWKAVAAFHNIRIAMGMMLCWLTCLITTSALMPNYLVDYLHLSPTSMGGVMSAIGIGATIGTVALAWLSDRIGRKPVLALGAIGTCFSLIMLALTGPNPLFLFAGLFSVHFFNNALITLTVGPISSETVPPGLVATASGVVIAVGELFGGGIAPVIAGQVAEHFGIGHILFLPIVTSGIGFLLAVSLHELRVYGNRPKAATL